MLLSDFAVPHLLSTPEEGEFYSIVKKSREKRRTKIVVEMSQKFLFSSPNFSLGLFDIYLQTCNLLLGPCTSTRTETWRTNFTKR